jgi:hypothetical protein
LFHDIAESLAEFVVGGLVVVEVGWFQGLLYLSEPGGDQFEKVLNSVAIGSRWRRWVPDIWKWCRSFGFFDAVGWWGLGGLPRSWRLGRFSWGCGGVVG